LVPQISQKHPFRDIDLVMVRAGARTPMA